MGRGGSKCLNSSPLHAAPWCEAKISPHLRPTTFTERRKPARDDMVRGGAKLTFPSFRGKGEKNRVQVFSSGPSRKLSPGPSRKLSPQ